MPIISTLDARLLDVAIEHFGRHGLSGASTRAIARDAQTPMSSITYHFTGKEGLYLAAAERIGSKMREWMGPAVARAAELAGSSPSVPRARAALHVIIARAVEIMVGQETASIAAFIVREQAEPTAAFARIYDGIMHLTLERIAALLRRIACVDLRDAEARLRAVALVGQVLIFRVARATVLRTLGWENIEPQQIKTIQRIVADHLDGVLDRLCQENLPPAKVARRAVKRKASAKR